MISAILAVFFSLPGFGLVAFETAGKNLAKRRLKVISDGPMVYDQKKRTIRCRDNVRILDGEMIIRCDRLEVYMKKKSPDAMGLTGNEKSKGEIDYVLAYGSVKIEDPLMMAYSETAEYRPDSKVVHLKGTRRRLARLLNRDQTNNVEALEIILDRMDHTRRTVGSTTLVTRQKRKSPDASPGANSISLCTISSNGGSRTFRDPRNPKNTYVVFSGDVHTQQGTLRIVSDRLEARLSPDPAGGGNSLDGVVARGRVKIVDTPLDSSAEGIMGFSDSAEYNALSDVITLLGKENEYASIFDSEKKISSPVIIIDKRAGIRRTQGKTILEIDEREEDLANAAPQSKVQVEIKCTKQMYYYESRIIEGKRRPPPAHISGETLSRYSEAPPILELQSAGN